MTRQSEKIYKNETDTKELQIWKFADTSLISLADFLFFSISRFILTVVTLRGWTGTVRKTRRCFDSSSKDAMRVGCGP